MIESEICLRRGQYYRDPDLPRTFNQGALVGTAWHAMMETYYGARRAWPNEWLAGETVEMRMLDVGIGRLTEGMADPLFTWQQDNANLRTPVDCVNTLNRMAGAWVTGRGHGLDWTLDGGRIIETEMGVGVEMEGHWFQGVLDLVVEYPQRGVVIVDHKTAARKWSRVKEDMRRLVQGPLYAEAMYRVTGWDAEWATYDVMTYGGAFTRVWVPVSQSVRGYTVSRWHDLAELIDSYQGRDLPMNPTSPMCQEKYCKHWDICPSGAALDRTALDSYPEQEESLK